MSHHFRVKVDDEWTFQIDDAALTSSLGGPNGAVHVDSTSVVREALKSPIDFPSLERASVPGDRIAVAVDPLLPNAVGALRGVVEAILQAGAEADHVTLLLPPSLAEVAIIWKQRAAANGLADVDASVHDPQNRNELAYLAAADDGRPIYLNRRLCDADVVIPVTCVPPPANPRWLGIHGGVYPTFSDVEAQGRYRQSLGRLSPAQQESWRKELDEVGWLLGVCMALGAVPGRNGTIHYATAGTPTGVCERCTDVATGAWRGALSRRVPLVIALIGHSGTAPDWDDFAAALAAARQAAGEAGAVAVCGGLKKGPGRSLSRLVGAADPQAVARRLHGETHDDSWAAQELAEALDRGPVYFAGRLPPEQVEDLGMAPIGGPEELERLANRFEECVVIHDAQFAAPYLTDQPESSA